MSRGQLEPHLDEGGQADAFVAERASAGRLRENLRRPRKNAPASAIEAAGPMAAAPDESPPLADLQATFLAVVTRPDSLSKAPRHEPNLLTRLVSGTDPIAGLSVYQNAYRARLIDALADDFPTVRYAMGAPAFARFADRVVTHHPSRTRNLNRYGRVFLDVLDAPELKLKRRPFLADLARFEWALVDAIHAPPPEKLDILALSAIPQEYWGELVFTPSPSLYIHRTAWPVNAYLQSFRHGGAPIFPPRSKSGFATAIYREGFRVWRLDLSPVAAALLEHLVEGKSLGAALTPLEGVAESATVMRWFEVWVRSGVFSSARLP